MLITRAVAASLASRVWVALATQSTQAPAPARAPARVPHLNHIVPAVHVPTSILAVALPNIAVRLPSVCHLAPVCAELAALPVAITIFQIAGVIATALLAVALDLVCRP